MKFYDVDAQFSTYDLENVFNSNPSVMFNPMDFGTPDPLYMFTASSDTFAPESGPPPKEPWHWDMYDWTEDPMIFFDFRTSGGSSSYNYDSSSQSSYASSGGSMAPATQDVTWIISFTIAFTGATKDDLPFLGPMYIQRVAEAAGV